MTQHMIPAQAVEAAAKGFAPHWDERSGWFAAHEFMPKLQAALEAAAPHMLEQAWQAGHTAGDGDQSAMWDARNSGKPVKYADVVTPNPYRPTP